MISHEKRLHLLREKLSGDNFLVEDSISLFYLTGLELSAGVLIVTPESGRLYVDGRYFEVASQTSFLEVFPIEENDPFVSLKTLSFNQDNTPYKRFKELKEKGLNLTPLNDPVSELRMIKDSDELELLRKASKLGVEGFEYAASLLREGITELEVAIELDIFWKRQGGKGVAFDPIIAFGATSSMPHYRPQQRLLETNNIVLMDMGVTLNNYHSDMTRVVFFGDVKPELKKIHTIVYEALHRALDLCKPGCPIGSVDKAARDHIEANGYKLPHSLGHGIGLEVHEAPYMRNKKPWDKTLLQPGMVVTVEPGIYIPNLGGIRLEDTIIITPDGYENLTALPY